jgi:hypothetical protein
MEAFRLYKTFGFAIRPYLGDVANLIRRRRIGCDARTGPIRDHGFFRAPLYKALKKTEGFMKPLALGFNAFVVSGFFGMGQTSIRSNLESRRLYKAGGFNHRTDRRVKGGAEGWV